MSCTIFPLFMVSVLENEKMSDNCLHQERTFRNRAALFIAARCHVTSRHVQDVITRTDKSSDKAGPEAEPLDVEWLCEEEDVVKSRQ